MRTLHARTNAVVTMGADVETKLCPVLCYSMLFRTIAFGLFLNTIDPGSVRPAWLSSCHTIGK
jgi:hypothetical protein